ncbi:hypothetical protein QJS04_geneDACA008006 [Acorus gramineus]|uniref:Protein RIK n=1 Tax=Acorus gramineus TaxID=55184 RepID=A0AAV9B9T5_ACOGR|nr:hypothetical protein QJS04_geneDACA008006 [Acorus gramineus]
MTEEGLAKPAEVVSNESKQQRKRRKWDQPAEAFISAGLAVPGGVPLGMGSLVGIALPGVAPFSASFPVIPIPTNSVVSPQMLQVPSIQQNVASIVQKLNQPKIQDELIAREIVINDAEATVRYKLTKRQTQEEIQKSTGAVVITRGKYQPPNAATDTERPLYLHISAGANLKDTSERVKAVDRAASMVEEILKSGSLPASTTTHLLLNTGQVTQPLSSSVFLGFDPNPTLNIVARIRGPNDQYINHIMNETGATVLLRGRGSRNPEGTSGEETQQPLHLYLSASNPKSLEDARILAENLLDTICTECGASRLSSCKAYGAVPPPQQLLVGAPNSSGEPEVAGSSSSAGGSSSIMPSFTTTTVPPVSSASSAVLYPPGSAISYGQSQSHTLTYSRPLVPGTCYSGYGGIYPQATPLQQVALALRQAPTQTASVVSPAVSTSTVLPKNNSNTIRQMDKQPPQKRKFLEQPIAPKRPAKINQNLRQGSEFLKPSDSSTEMHIRSTSSMPPPKLASLEPNMMPPPPPRSMPPPPPPKFTSPKPHTENGETKPAHKKPSPTEPVPDTLAGLLDYGEEEEDDEGIVEEQNGFVEKTEPKPFWAV